MEEQIKYRMENLLERIDGDPDAEHLVEDLIHRCILYVDAVVKMESRLQILGLLLGSSLEVEPAEHQEILAELERSEMITLKSLIASINAVNRLCDKLGVARVYPGNDDTRSKGDFAFGLVSEYFAGRKATIS